MATIKKISDYVFNNHHPNNINEDYYENANYKTLPSIKIGECYYFGSLRTSTVTEIISQTEDKIEFKTINSKYLVTK